MNGYADKARAAMPERRAHARATERYACDICDVRLTTSWLLRRHCETEKHHEAVRVAAGGNGKPISAQGEYKRKTASRAREQRRYFCGVCNHSFTAQSTLNEHLKTQKHIKNAAKAALLVSKSPTTLQETPTTLQMTPTLEQTPAALHETQTAGKPPTTLPVTATAGKHATTLVVTPTPGTRQTSLLHLWGRFKET
ncbi:hypothetical protein FQN50_000167 [Emmonsiellopsis sp. PD_5]|nr:hypothetical protein FQN50_000167 [Emmonsiellopsis sp. PD_5]